MGTLHACLDELIKLGAVSPDEAQAALERYEKLQDSKPTGKQIARYAGLGALASVGTHALQSGIEGSKPFGLGPKSTATGVARNIAGRLAAGAVTGGALPLLRSHLDRKAELGTLRDFIQQPDVQGQLKAAAKIKSNDRMPARSKKNVDAMRAQLESWDSPHKEDAMKFLNEVTPGTLFEMLHSARRWYSGQSMGGTLVKNQEHFAKAMKLDPESAIGVYRGFKVDKDSPLAALSPGDKITIPVTRNGGLSSWSVSEAATNKFSGASKDKVGLIVKLVGGKDLKPVLAPPEHTEPWFNEMYSHLIGKSWRPTEGEYLVHSPEVNIEIVKVKRSGKQKTAGVGAGAPTTTSEYSGPMGGGAFPLVSGQGGKAPPSLRAPLEKSAFKTWLKVATFTGGINMLAPKGMTPGKRLASSRAIGTAEHHIAPGPSISQVSKRVQPAFAKAPGMPKIEGWGKPDAGAIKSQG